MVSNIRSEIFQKKLRKFWTFAAQHAGEVYVNHIRGLPPCEFEFGQRILARVVKPINKLAPILQPAVFLGYAPNVTHGYFIMRSDGIIELTSNITEDTKLDEPEPVLQENQQPRLSARKQKGPQFIRTTDDRMVDAIMGVEGGEGWYWNRDNAQGEAINVAACVNRVVNSTHVMKAKFDSKLWDTEEIKEDEIPEALKESGAIPVKLKDVRNSIGKDRAQWKLALEAELNSLRETGAIHEVKHVPKGVQVLPMKMVLTLKPEPGMETKKKKARVCVCGNFQEKKTNGLILHSKY